jgi:hypothetical protein
MIGDELDVVEAHHAGAYIGEPKRLEVSMMGRPMKSRRPSPVEGAHHLVARVGGRGAREPEGIGALMPRNRWKGQP